MAKAAKLAVALVLGADALRRQARTQQKGQALSGTKFIADVAVLNYAAAYVGEVAPTAESEQDWIVMMQPETSDSQIQKLCQVARNGCKSEGFPGGIAFFETRATESDLEKIVASADPGSIEFIEPDQTATMPDLELENEAEGTLQGEGPSSLAQKATWDLDRIGVSQRTRLGKNTYAYVLDTGVRTSHKEFEGRAQPALDGSGGAFVECRDGDRTCAADKSGHGTHCAGVIGARNYGVAPKANIRAVKVFADTGSTNYGWVLNALDWLSTNAKRPAVASMSFGMRGMMGIGRAYERAVDDVTAKGITVVVASGNDGGNACNYSPALAASAITVGNTDQNDKQHPTSNYGNCVNIFAPGTKINSLWFTSDSATKTLSGTSMACPHVSGAALLVLQANRNFTPKQVLAKLVANAEKGKVKDAKGSPNVLLSVRGL